jgi:CRP/FNR family transcriptional regulator, anaerobic regulatory protein
MATAQPVLSYGSSLNTCANCSMHSFCLASELHGDQLDKFESNRGNIRILNKGQHLFRAGEKFNSFYIVRSGMVKATVNSEDGEEQIIGFHLPGEILGIDGLENDLYQSTAAALETSSVCTLPFQKIAALGSELPGLQKQLWRQTSREITSRQELLLTMGHKDSDARIAGFLLSLSMRFKRIGYSATSIHLPMSRHEIGNYLGMTVETVSRSLTRFEKAGLISKEKRNISLKNISAITDICFGNGYKQKPDTATVHHIGVNVADRTLTGTQTVNRQAVAFA